MNKPKIDQLMEWDKRPEVDQMIEDGVSANRITQWMNQQGFKISVPTVITYIKMRKGESESEDELKERSKPTNVQEILDEIIMKGYITLGTIKKISPDILLEAIKLKHEITKDSVDNTNTRLL